MPARKRIDWRLAAVELARRIPRERLHPAVLAWADCAPARARWGVGFSGGADSLALLLLLWAHWPSRRRGLRVLHFNHRLRGAESRADARFCGEVSRALGLEATIGAWAGSHRDASEAEAREARMKFFQKNARAIWLAHHQDDVAETMLMRLARGSGSAGLAAPRPVRNLPDGRVYLRPLLELKKAEIIATIRSIGVPWREDSSNAAGRYFRNRIRATVVPRWVRAARRDAVAGASLSRSLLEEDDAAIEAWLAELHPVRTDGSLELGRLRGKPRAVLRRALHQWMASQAGRGISRQGFDALLAAIMSGVPTRHSLGPEGFAVISRGVLRFDSGRKKLPRKVRGPN